jgi:Zn finger protein HypA/HybF involved in hydrogenase expression
MDKKHKKKLKRAAKKRKEKAAAQETQNKLKKQINMFDRLPSSCSTCSAEFPKTREAHMTWRVVVKEEKQKVWLFCPDCQEKAKQIVENNNEI